jgi:hypothetical protein
VGTGYEPMSLVLATCLASVRAMAVIRELFE